MNYINTCEYYEVYVGKSAKNLVKYMKEVTSLTVSKSLFFHAANSKAQFYN
jgi:hypothetical protein